MKVLYRKGVTHHPGPESWGIHRKVSTQALTGESAGPVWNPEKSIICGGRPTYGRGEGNTDTSPLREDVKAPTGSKTWARTEALCTGIGRSHHRPESWHQVRMRNPKGVIS